MPLRPGISRQTRIQSRQQAEAAKDQFRKEVINGFINARYDATGRRDIFLSAQSDKLEQMYRDMMEEDFIVIKEKLSRVWHDVETGQQSLTAATELEKNIIAMKAFFDSIILEYREIKDADIPNTMEFFKDLKFGDFLKDGPNFITFIKNYREALRLIRVDLFKGR